MEDTNELVINKEKNYIEQIKQLENELSLSKLTIIKLQKQIEQITNSQTVCNSKTDTFNPVWNIQTYY